MILTLRTKENRERARELASEIIRNLNATVHDLKSLQMVFNRAHDFGMQNTLAGYTGLLEEIRGTEHDKVGLRPFLRELLAALRKAK